MVSKQELRQKRNDNARKIMDDDSRHRNCIRLHPQNTVEHEMKKAEICWELLQEDKEFITEARFENRDIRADVFVLDNGNIFEVETDPSDVDERKSDYPDDQVFVIPLNEE